jgi:hypothetical protein
VVEGRVPLPADVPPGAVLIEQCRRSGRNGGNAKIERTGTVEDWPFARVRQDETELFGMATVTLCTNQRDTDSSVSEMFVKENIA